MMSRILILSLTLFFSPWSLAKEAMPMADDPALEARVMALSAELRCLVCQNQTIADSHAELAIDLKNQVREMMIAGKTDDEIREYMVERYGDFVLYKPPVSESTFLLWFGPMLLFFIGLVVLMINLKKRQRLLADAAMTEQDHKRVDELLKRQG